MTSASSTNALPQRMGDIENPARYVGVSSIGLANINVANILVDDDPRIIKRVEECLTIMDADGDSRLTGTELVQKVRGMVLSSETEVLERAKAEANALAAGERAKATEKRLSFWKMAAIGSTFGCVGLLGVAVAANKITKDTVVDSHSMLQSKATGDPIRTQQGSVPLQLLVPKGEHPPEERCRRLTTDESVCEIYNQARRLVTGDETAANEEESLGLGYLDDAALDVIRGSVGGSVQVEQGNGDVESLQVHSISHDGENVVINHGEWVLIPTHECLATALEDVASEDDAPAGLFHPDGQGRKLQEMTAYQLCLAVDSCRAQRNGCQSSLNTCRAQRNDFQSESQRLQGTCGALEGALSLNVFWGCHGYLTEFGLPNLDVSGVTRFNYMFQLVENFNQDLSRWEMSNAVTMVAMFEGASTFQQDLSGWRFPSIEYNSVQADRMFSGTKMTDISQCPCFKNKVRACPGTTNPHRENDENCDT